jgi:parvulin-like peptidyl-prolyl isomerase
VRDPVKRHRFVGLVLGAVLVLLVIGTAAFGGIGRPGVPDGAVALVDDVPEFECVIGGKPTQCNGEVTDEEFDDSLEQAAFNLNLPETPPEDDPQFEQVQESALANSIQVRWVRGEAAERGIELADRDIDVAYEQLIREQLGGQKGLERFLKDAPYTEEEIREVAALNAVAERVQTELVGEGPPDVPEELVEDFYEQNPDQFTQPESRDVREIVNDDESAVADAKAALEKDDSDKSWEKVASEFSTGASKDEGGLREGVVEGQDDPALEEEIFAAPEGELVGPFETEAGFYLIEVVGITPEEVAPLEDASEQIEAQLAQGIQQEEQSRVVQAFGAEWRARTTCAEGYRIQLCSNADPAPDVCPSDDPSEREGADPALLDQGCEAPVAPRPVALPGTNTGIPGSPPQVLPQGPIKPPEETVPGGLPPGLEGLPPGAAPPGAPPGTAPPQGAPPQGAPPQGAAPAPPPGG